jgi:hypothetical protein
MPKLTGRIMTCEACITEALHLLENSRAGIAALRGFLARIEIAAPFAGEIDAVLNAVTTFAPAMDLADGCLVVLTGKIANAIVVTTEHNDFATYRVPFVSPKGLFA